MPSGSGPVAWASASTKVCGVGAAGSVGVSSASPGDVAQGIKAFKKGMQDDEKTAEKPEPVKTIDHNNTSPTAARSDVGSKAV